MHFLSPTRTINSLQIYCAKQIPSVITSWRVIFAEYLRQFRVDCPIKMISKVSRLFQLSPSARHLHPINFPFANCVIVFV